MISLTNIAGYVPCAGCGTRTDVRSSDLSGGDPDMPEVMCMRCAEDPKLLEQVRGTSTEGLTHLVKNGKVTEQGEALGYYIESGTLKRRSTKC